MEIDFSMLLSYLKFNDNFTLPYHMVRRLKGENIKRTYIERKDDELVAYAIVTSKLFNDDVGEVNFLEFLDVSELYQRKGYGTTLIKRILIDYPTLYIQSILDSHQFYIKCGFDVIEKYNPDTKESILTDK